MQKSERDCRWLLGEIRHRLKGVGKSSITKKIGTAVFPGGSTCYSLFREEGTENTFIITVNKVEEKYGKTKPKS